MQQPASTYEKRQSFAALLSAHRHAFTATRMLADLPFDDGPRDAFRESTAEVLAHTREEIARRETLIDEIRNVRVGGFG